MYKYWILCISTNVKSRHTWLSVYIIDYVILNPQHNLAPIASNSFDPKRHTCRGDVLRRPPGLVVILKWSKTNQTRDKVNLIPLPEIPNSPLCLVSAYFSMINAIPSRSSNDPFPLYPDTRKALTTNTLSKFLRTFSATLRIPPLTMHQFRRNTASPHPYGLKIKYFNL